VNDTSIEVFAVPGTATSGWLDTTGTQGGGAAGAQTNTTVGNVTQADSLAVFAATYFNASATGAAPTNYTDRFNTRDATRSAVFHVADHTPLTSGATEAAAYTAAGASGNDHATVIAVYSGVTSGTTYTASRSGGFEVCGNATALYFVGSPPVAKRSHSGVPIVHLLPMIERGQL
jgi:hypothetical protein